MSSTHLLAVSFFAGILVACAGQPSTSGESSPMPEPGGATGATGATLSSAAPSTSPAQSATGEGRRDRIEGPYTVVFRQTGGIAALNMETKIDTGARTISYGGPRNQTPQMKDLTGEDIRELTRVLNDADVGTFGPVKGPAVSDAFSYTITVSVRGRDYVASWQDGATPPDSYLVVQRAIQSLRDAKFSGRPQAGAPDR